MLSPADMGATLTGVADAVPLQEVVPMGIEQVFVALIKASPIAAAVVALCWVAVERIVPAIQKLRDGAAQIRAAEFARDEAARRTRDEAWQASLVRVTQNHEQVVGQVVAGYRETLAQHERTMDRFATQTDRMGQDIGQVKADVAVMRADVHAVVQRMGEPSGTFATQIAKKTE